VPEGTYLSNLSSVESKTTLILGVDECNFSPSLAGDCMVCCYYNSSGEKIKGVTDSKQVIKVTQRRLFKELTDKGIFTIAPATVNSIDHLGIYTARNYAVVSAVQMMLMELEHLDVPFGEAKVLLDGYWSQTWLEFFKDETGIPFKGIIHGDAKVYEISAASIVARVYIDALFEGYDHFWPGYNVNHNHGSPDPVMYRKLAKNGPSPIFRTKNYGEVWWKNIMSKKAKYRKKHGKK
jgi:ribonuclease HII